jgi:rhamnopyranosyl-N-acetylglucosaminyl-diphospho-decaprenol beta-1,3/1,4-galactofuranosyltransferase
VHAIIVTYRRPELLLDTVEAVVRQTTRPTFVSVVDNAADSELRAQLDVRAPDVRYLGSPTNLGPGGGFALALHMVQPTQPTDWYWLLDDDSPPAVNALELALATARDLEGRVGAVGLRGGHVVRGRIRHDLPLGTVTEPTRADFVLIDGSIVSAEAVFRVGLPRADFFIMMEDLEYSLRIKESGLPVWVRPADGSLNLYQGSGAPWRGYYQSRNHLRMTLERRSVAWLWGWLVREAGINTFHLRHRRWRSILLRARGATDALRNRMGRVVEP